MKKLDKKKVNLGCLLLSIIMVVLICGVFLLKNGFISKSKVHNELLGFEVSIDNEVVILEEGNYEIEIEKVLFHDSDNKEVISNIIIENKYSFKVSLKYVKNTSGWSIKDIRFY